ncbi:putative DNA repair protein Rad18 [Lophium mytilinum]|uniref:Putative DNA repair protein Rad18 n=1 Tax=Lophium mytilinum TaxID=390894 RepID=A0A6A6R6K8_9PEZI|nr:putative DNA repair protein Rad18 [Lophium mytilinum]
MAPIRPSKRPRSRTENGEASGTHSAGLRGGSGKRPRLSPASEDEESDAEISYASEEVHVSKEKHKAPAEDWETARDGGFEDLQYQEIDDQHSTQIIQKRFEKHRERLQDGKVNDPADNGVIEEVKCTNFMCHDRLTVKLGPLINFIIGHNGSGKSAVLTAITLCLGGKATATNRGQSLKSFIKEGRDAALLSVRIKNQGSAAYKPEIYGKSIIVERQFSKTGSNGYKIKNANDKTVSTKKADLDDILDAFCLQLDNPMNVLTQDMARQFLNHSNAKDKYKFFLKGTQLEALDNDYKLLSDTINALDSKHDLLQETVEIRKKAFDVAAAKKKQAEQLDGLHLKINELVWQMAWAQVAGQEERLAEIDQMVQNHDETVNDKRTESEVASAKYDAANEARETAEKSLKVLRDSLAPVQAQRTTAKEAYDAKRTEITNIMIQEREIQGGIHASKAAITKYTNLIQEERHRQEQADGGQHAQKLADIQEAQSMLAQAKTSLESHRETRTTITQNLQKAERELADFSPAKGQKKEQIREKQNLIRNIQSDQGRWSAGYDGNLPSLLRAIEAERRFKTAPVGPMGRHVRLLKPEWSSILEKQAGPSLNSFVVTNKADESILSDLMKRTRCVSNILIGNPRPLDTSNKEPSAELETWMRVLKIDNDLVRNQMIIGQAIDQTVLIKDRTAAFNFISADVRPQNVRQVFAMSDQKRGAGHLFQLTSGGAPKLGPIHPWNKRVRMQTDQESQLGIEKENLNQLQNELRSIEAQEKVIEGKVAQCRKAVGSYTSVENRLRVEYQRADELSDRLRDELEAETPQAGKLKDYEKMLREKEAEKEACEESLQDAQDARAEKKLEEETAQKAFKSLELEGKEIEARVTKVTQKIQKLEQARENALREKNLAIESLRFVEGEKARVVEGRQEQADTVEDFTRKATLICARVPLEPGVTHDGLEKKRERLIKDLKNSEARLGATKEELVHAEIEANAAHKEAKEIMERSLELMTVLKEALMDRRDRWGKFRRYIQAGARITFTYLLSERSFRGSLEISAIHKTLDIKVEPDITKSDERGRQTQTLSGGEKSFSTICLLLALWDAMGSPIRCLDEFDVFMDSVNRDISMKMMIEAARRAVGRQFILITPQAMGSVSIQEDVRIIKMTDPDRGQTTLPFTS